MIYLITFVSSFFLGVLCGAICDRLRLPKLVSALAGGLLGFLFGVFMQRFL